MIRALAYLIIISAVVAAAVWIAGRPGHVTLTWGQWRIDSSVAFLALCIAAIASVIAVLYRLWFAVRHAPGAFRDSLRARRRTRGYRALTLGMAAVAAGDVAEARRQARRADALLGEPPLTMLLSAQAAQLGGDEDAARRYFNAMLERPETAFMGLRGLLLQAERAGDRGAALRYAREAHAARPKAPWAMTELLELEIEAGAWADALATLDRAMRAGAVSGAEGREKKAVLELALAREKALIDDNASAISHARTAHKLAPGLLPATLKLAALLAAAGETRAAERTIHEAWRTTPHPEFADIYAGLRAGDAMPAPLARMKRVEKLVAHNPDHVESHLALARAAHAAGLWGAARGHADVALRTGEIAAACRLMAEIEEADGGDAAKVGAWLRRAADAPPDPAWICAGCGAVSVDWTPACERCGAFGTVNWRAPDWHAPDRLGTDRAGTDRAGTALGQEISPISGKDAATDSENQPKKDKLPQFLSEPARSR